MYDIAAVATGVSNFVKAVEPIIDIAAPEAAPILAIGEKILQGIAAGAPTAVSLYNQIKDGTPATPAQIAQFEADYENAYQKLRSDLAARLADSK